MSGRVSLGVILLSLFYRGKTLTIRHTRESSQIQDNQFRRWDFDF